MQLYHFTQITSKIQPVFKPLAKASHRTNLLLWLDTHRCFWQFWRGRLTVATPSTLRQPGSIQQAVYYSTQNDFPVPLLIAKILTLSIENPFRRSNLQNNREVSRIFRPKPREIPILSLINFEGENRLMVMTIDQLQWRQKTYFRGAALIVCPPPNITARNIICTRASLLTSAYSAAQLLFTFIS